MNRYTSLRLIITLALALLFSSACGTRRLTATSNVEGTVTMDGRRFRVAGIPVILKPLGIQTTTDANGQFAFDIKMGDLEPGVVHILGTEVIIEDEDDELLCHAYTYFQPELVIAKGLNLELTHMHPNSDLEPITVLINRA